MGGMEGNNNNNKFPRLQPDAVTLRMESLQKRRELIS